MWKLEQQRLTPKYNILRSLVPLVKHYFVTMEEDENKSKITFQCCNGSVICSGRSVELLRINFLHACMSTLGLYPEYIDPVHLYFWWTSRTKMQHIYHRIYK